MSDIMHKTRVRLTGTVISQPEGAQYVVVKVDDTMMGNDCVTVAKTSLEVVEDE